MKNCVDEFGTNFTIYRNSWNDAPPDLKNPIVIAFERSDYKKPTNEQILEFRIKEKIVESLGGRMDGYEFQCGGMNPRFYTGDIINMKKFAKNKYPNLKIIDTWNGEGCYTFSIGGILE